MNYVIVFLDRSDWHISNAHDAHLDGFAEVKTALEIAKGFSSERGYVYGVQYEMDFNSGNQPEYVFINGVQYRQYPEV
jgi:hypothetical protein